MRFTTESHRRMHWADAAVGRAFARTRMFSEGFGDLETLLRMRGEADLFRHVETPSPTVSPAALGKDGCWARTLRWRSAEVDARFEDVVRNAEATWLTAAPLAGQRSGRPAVVVMSASGEEGADRRRKVLAPLVRDGLDAFILENPFYGTRRRPGQRSARLPTVFEQFHMNHASVREAVGLVHLLRTWGRDRVGLLGYSMGGYMVCLAASALAEDGYPVPLVAVAAGRSPRSVYLDGALSWAVDFASLEAGFDETLRRESGASSARDLLGSFFEATTEHLRPLHPKSRVVLAAADRDGFVFPSETDALLRMWPGASLRRYRGGHTHVFLSFDKHVRRAVRDAFV